jgi:hypothetical protein
MDVEFPDACPAAFAITLRDGTQVPYQRITEQQRLRIVRPYRDIPGGSFRIVQTVFAEVTVPALGYTTLVYKQVPVEQGQVVKDSLMKSPTMLENDVIRLSFESDGTVTLTDLVTGENYPGLNAFEDGGDNGDGWKYIPPANDRLITGLSEVSVKVTVSGPFVASAVVSGTLTVPTGLAPDQKGRSAETVGVPVTTTLTLRRGARQAEVETVTEEWLPATSEFNQFWTLQTE